MTLVREWQYNYIIDQVTDQITLAIAIQSHP